MRKISIFSASAFGSLAVLFSLFSALAGFPSFRDQHLGTALVYLQEGVDLLRAKIIGFNATDTPTIQEIPLWQAGAAWVMQLTGGWWGGANLFSLAVFSLAIFPIYQMGRRFLGREGAWWAVALFLAQPVIFDAAGLASPDGMSLVAALWAYDRIRSFVQKGGVTRGAVALCLAALSALLKLPFFMTAGLAVALETIPSVWRSKMCWLRLGATALFSGSVFLIWTRYTDSWFDQALWPFVDLRVAHNPAMVYWYFGDWDYRLSPAVWAQAAWKAANSLLGSFVLAGIALGGWLLRGNREGRAWLVGAVLTTTIFTHLVLHHRHYYLMFSPAVALAMAAGSVWVLDRCFRRTTPEWAWSAVGFFMLMAAALVQGLMGREIVHQFDSYPRQTARLVAEHTAPGDRLLIVGGGWGGETLFRAERQGLSIWNTRFLEKPENLKKARELGFNKLVIIRESPLLVALQKTNPGGAGYVAEPFSAYLSPVADAFPILYQDAQLMIRKIPSS